MEFNQFQKELRDRGIEGQQAYVFTMLYERLSDLAQQVTLSARIVNELADAVNKFADLHEHTQRQLKIMMRHGRPDGVEVHSVANDPDDTEH